MRWEKGLGAENPKWSCGGSVLGLPCETVVEGGEGRWREVVWWFVGDNGGHGVAHLQVQGGGKGWGAENPKPSTTAQFWAASGHWEV